MGLFFGKHFEQVEPANIGGKSTTFYVLNDGATATGTKNRLSFNWFRPDGTRSRYSSDENYRRDCVQEVEQHWQEERKYL